MLAHYSMLTFRIFRIEHLTSVYIEAYWLDTSFLNKSRRGKLNFGLPQIQCLETQCWAFDYTTLCPLQTRK
jgi:hypothetical protein